LSIALLAHSVVTRPRSARHSYGLLRAEVVGAQVNGIILVATAGWIGFEALGRIGDPQEVDGGGLLSVASLGLLVNLGSAAALARSRKGDLNMRGAFLHMAADALGSVGAIAAGVAVVVWGANWVDPAVSALVGVLVLVPAWRLLRDTMHVLLEGTPRAIDPEDVASAIEEEGGVEGVHHLHLWSLASNVPALSAHVVVDGEISMHEAQQRGDSVRRRLSERFGIEHATLELECHACDAPDDDVAGHGQRPRQEANNKGNRHRPGARD
jgi:cobalt-zinc-cadmium efflux system protein